jgi:hypothetical protein
VKYVGPVLVGVAVLVLIGTIGFVVWGIDAVNSTWPGLSTSGIQCRTYQPSP